MHGNLCPPQTVGIWGWLVSYVSVVGHHRHGVLPIVGYSAVSLNLTHCMPGNWHQSKLNQSKMPSNSTICSQPATLPPAENYCGSSASLLGIYEAVCLGVQVLYARMLAMPALGLCLLHLTL